MLTRESNEESRRSNVATEVLMKESVTAATAAALAAKTSVEAVMNGERPWILVDNLGAPPIPEKPTEFTLLPGTPYFVFTLKVFGHTPCRILNVGLRFHREFLKEGIIAEEPNLPEEPVYWRGMIKSPDIPESGVVKAPNETIQLGITLEEGPLLPDAISAINEGKQFLCAYGFVAYVDSFEREHLTRFCYIYRVSRRAAIHSETGKNIYPSLFVMGGPSCYNRYS